MPTAQAGTKGRSRMDVGASNKEVRRKDFEGALETVKKYIGSDKNIDTVSEV